MQTKLSQVDLPFLMFIYLILWGVGTFIGTGLDTIHPNSQEIGFSLASFGLALMIPVLLLAFIDIDRNALLITYLNFTLASLLIAMVSIVIWVTVTTANRWDYVAGIMPILPAFLYILYGWKETRKNDMKTSNQEPQEVHDDTVH